MTGSDRMPSDSDLAATTIRGVGWVYLSSGVNAVGQLVYTIVLARLLAPRTFGVFAIAVLTAGVAVQLSQLGIAPALIQKPTLTETDVRAGFTLSALVGVVLFAAVWAGAPWIAAVFHDAAATSVVRAMGFVVFLQALRTTPEALLRRGFRFREIALASIVAFGLGYLAVGIGSASLGAGVWSLVAAQVTAASIFLSMIYARTRHPLRPTINRASLGAIAHYGWRLSLVNLLEFVGLNVDTFAVARYSSTEMLGQYNRAFNLVIVPLNLLSAGLVQVLFSGFSTLQRETTRLRESFVHSASISAAIVFPLCAGIAVAAAELVTVTLGTRYGAAIDTIPYLAAFGALATVSRLYAALCDAVARLGVRLLIQAMYVAVLVVAMLAVAGGPLWRYAAVLAACEVVRHTAFIAFVSRIVGLDRSHLLKVYARPAFAAAAVASASAALRLALITAGVEAPLALLLGQIAIDALVVVLLVRWGVLRFVLLDVRERLGERGAKLDALYASRTARFFFGDLTTR